MLQSVFEYRNMISPYSKTTIVKPLREKNDFRKLQKDHGSTADSFKKRKENIGIYGKQIEAIKNLSEDKKKKFLKIDSAYSHLHAELEEIRKWKTLIDMESKEKEMKIEEMRQSTEEQRKIAINYQLENENLHLQLVEEIQQRSFVSEKLHATKEMYSALKKHFNTLQSHFEYRNRIEEMIKAADNKRCSDIENLKEMFNKMQLEQSDRIEYLNCALEAESNKLLDMRERFELQLSEVENQREALCTMVRNYENEVGNLGNLLEAEKSKVQFLEKEKEKLKCDLMEAENSNKYYDTMLQEKEEALRSIEASKEEQEKKLNFQYSLVSDLEGKCRELLEANEALNTEVSIVPSLKQMNEQIKNEVVDLEKRLEEEVNKTSELLSTIQTLENETSNYEQKMKEEELKVETFQDLEEKFKRSLESNTALLNERDELDMKLKDLSSHLLETEADKEKLSILCEEKSEFIATLKNDYEDKLVNEENKLNSIKKEYEQLLSKLETAEGHLADNSKTNAEMEEKIRELEELRTALSKADDDLNQQKQSTFEVLRLLQDTEAKYNKDRLAKETEIISYKGKIEKLEFEAMLLKCDVENLEKLKPENAKLNEDVEKLKLEISELLRKEEEFRNQVRASSEKRVDTEGDKILEERSSALSLQKGRHRESEMGRKVKALRKEEEFRNQVRASSEKRVDTEGDKILEERSSALSLQKGRHRESEMGRKVKALRKEEEFRNQVRASSEKRVDTECDKILEERSSARSLQKGRHRESEMGRKVKALRKEEELRNQVRASSEKRVDTKGDKILEERSSARSLQKDCHRESEMGRKVNALRKEEEFRNQVRASSEKRVDTEGDKILEERSSARSLQKGCHRESEMGRKVKAKDIAPSDMENETDDDESSVFVDENKNQQPVIEKKLPFITWDSSGSECLELVYDEQPNIGGKRVYDSKPKARDTDSSGSECLELVYDEKSHEAIGLSTAATKSGSGINKLPATPNDEPKLFPFKTKRKRDGQNVTQEDIVRKKFGLPPRKKQGTYQEPSPLQFRAPKNSEKFSGFSNAKARLENPSWKPAAKQGSEPTTPIQRKFFARRGEERNTPKSSGKPTPWF